ncbi:FimV family protein [Psychrobacter sp. ANT_WB68]|uniref:type IV pilus assembly protein FimV n=1 Tax=Psychrobacter sp. ANT_WB68 TaxID=2597355 RepID=UPI0011F3A781|nr:peptigoglycan-binding protein LysM [Psychrobacter sp. ANT_WB68]KAA0914229.1 peptigoglycan-binding protein LysM [Psychrobacter sp. ANT_WB68]
MSCHLSHRLTTVHRSVSMALLYSVGYAALMSNAQAATIGKTVITSAQHEPLAASIMVTDIKTADFSASLANSTIYQQMGLTPTDSMTVRFQPTSATSGHVLITTTKPVSKPFADVVLAINDGTQRNVIPKTLLMPLNDSLPITPTENIVAEAKKPNLPMVSTTNAQPLIVKKGTPPPLLLAPTAVITPATQSNTTVYSPNRLDNSRLDDDRLNNDANLNNHMIAGVNDANNRSTGNLDGRASATGLTTTQFDILNINITRQIQPNVANNTGNVNNTNMMAVTPKAPTPANPLSTAKNNSDGAAPYSNTQPNQIASQQTLSSNNLSTISSNDKVFSASGNNDSSPDFNYTVQRNDNLWIIAQQIAEKNNLDVQIVMNEIQTQNPNAFINKNADQLKADAQLSLPKYDVVPSQKKLQAAISEQRNHYRKANTPLVKKTNTPKAAPKTKTESAQAAKRTEKPVIKKTQTLPTAQFSVLAPGHDGSADGTKTKSGMATGSGLSTEVLDILKSSRQSTAAQAQRLSKTNSTLGSYTKKLQLQNQKLAELQARLKKLRNQ